MPRRSYTRPPPAEKAVLRNKQAVDLGQNLARVHEEAEKSHRLAVEMRREIEERSRDRSDTESTTMKVVVIGASAGGLEAIRKVLRGLNPGFPAAIFVVLHMGSETPSALSSVLARTTGLPVGEAVHGAEILPGRVYVARPDFHLVLEPGRMLLTRGPRENRQRPSIDALFRSAARAYSRQVIAVLMSGLLDDGTAGLQAVKARGGKALIQDPDDALFPSMPLNAMQFVRPDALSSAAEMGPLLRHMVNGNMARSKKPAMAADTEERANRPVPGPLKRPMILSCPDCNGVLQEYGEGGLVRFRCQVGHEFSSDGLVDAQNDEVERALWTGVRSLLESAAVARRMAEHSDRTGRARAAHKYLEQAQSKEQEADLLRRLIYARSEAAPPRIEEDGNSQKVAQLAEEKKGPGRVEKKKAGNGRKRQ